MFTYFTALLATVAVVQAAPAPQPGSPASRGGRPFPLPGIGLAAIAPLLPFTNCPVSNAVLSLPADQTALAIPDGTKPVAITLGIGTQNYTCTDAGTYTAIGAVATLFDISCLYGDPRGKFATVQEDIFRLPTRARDAIVAFLSKTPLNIGAHYFIQNPITGTGISPKFAQAANGGKIFTTLAKKGGIKSPNKPEENVDWLQLSSIQGDWASTVFRVDTKLGHPPATCSQVNSTITVPYGAKYYFFK